MNVMRAILPLLALVVLTLLAVFPWGIATPDGRFVLALLPGVAILAMNMRRPRAVREWMAFSAGLVIDVVSGEPLGFWALVCLAAFAVAGLLQPLRERSMVAGWGLGAVGLGVLVLSTGALISLYSFQAAAWRSLVTAAAVLVVVYPLLDALLAPFASRPEPQDNGYLLRGGG